MEIIEPERLASMPAGAAIADAPAMDALLENVACDLCGSAEHDLLFKKKETRTWWNAKCRDDSQLDRDFEFSVVRCRECRHVFVNPRLIPQVNGDIYARYWRSKEPKQLQPNEYARHVCRQLARFRPLGTLLDFGCGWGSVLNEARKVGWRATGIEVDPRKVEFCRQQGVDTILGDLLDRPFAENSFDAVIAEQVFEHLYRPVEYMREVHRLLKPGGVVYVGVPNWGGLAAAIKGKRWHLVHPVSHVRYFDRASLAGMLAALGFEVLKPAYWNRSGGLLGRVSRAGKTFIERTTGYYPTGLVLFGRKSR